MRSEVAAAGAAAAAGAETSHGDTTAALTMALPLRDVLRLPAALPPPPCAALTKKCLPPSKGTSRPAAAAASGRNAEGVGMRRRWRAPVAMPASDADAAPPARIEMAPRAFSERV